MKILIIGARGNIGSLIVPKLIEKHEVVTAGRTSGDMQVDISSAVSIAEMFGKVGKIDACVCIAGDSYSGDLMSMTENNLSIGIDNKLLGQINLVLIGHPYLNNTGSFTLISGKMGDQPAKHSAGKAVVNGAINSFVLAASLEMPRGIRINVVSPAKVADIPPDDLVNAFLQSIEGNINGRVLKINYN